MTVNAAQAPRHLVTAPVDWKRYVIIALLLITLAGLALNYVTTVHYKTEDPLSVTGIDFLMGHTAGKSEGVPHPLVIGIIAFAALALAMNIIYTDKHFYTILFSILSLVCVLLFMFDIVYQAKGEFAFKADSVGYGIGWYVSVVAAAAAMALSIWRKAERSTYNRALELEKSMGACTLPNGYKVLSTKEIIARDFKSHWPVYLMILPMVLFYLVWCYGPLYGIIIAFNDFTPKRGVLGSKWVGLQWFRDFFRSPYAWRTIRNTLLISFYNLLFGFPLPIILALMLNEMRSIKYKRVVQTITYMPYFISLVVLCGILKDFCEAQGLFGGIQRIFGVDPVNLLGDAKYFRTIYVGSEVWQRLGWDSIIFLSALSGIDTAQYEAATIDGAGKLKQVVHVTLPGILPTISILLILRVGSIMGVGYEKIILLYNGLTYETADVVSTYVYRKGIIEANFSFSTAINLFNSIINFLLVVFANKMSAVLTENSLW